MVEAIPAEVRLCVPNHEAMPARAGATADGRTELTLLGPPRTPLAGLVDERAFLEFAEGQATCRVPGTITAADGDGTLIFAHSGPVEVRRRQFLRTDYVARVFLGAEGARPAKGITVNVSAGGLLVRGADAFDVGAALRFDLDLVPGQPRISGDCRLVRRTPDGFGGVQFAAVSDEDRTRLERFVAERERQRLRGA